MKNLKQMWLLPAALVAPLMCAPNAHASNATVAADTLSQNSWTADNAAPDVGILASQIKLSDIVAGVLDVGTCTYNSGCIAVFDPDQGQSRFASTTDATQRDMIREAILAWRGMHSGATFEVGLAPTKNDADFNKLLTAMSAVAVATVNPTWAPSNQSTFQTFAAANSITFYAPVGLVTFSHDNVVPVGAYKTTSGVPQVLAALDGGIAVAPGGGESASGLTFDWGTHQSLTYAAASLAARTDGATKSQINAKSGTSYFSTLSGSSSTHGRIIGALTF